ncbi:MAG: hypothetical protein WCA78_13740 [Rhizomicrobium sp.]
MAGAGYPMPVDSFCFFYFLEGETAMRFVLDKKNQWSDVGLKIALVSVAAVTVLSLLHGVMEGQFRDTGESHNFTMWLNWCYDFRMLFGQLILPGTVLFVGAKFIETRSIFTVGFDKMDAAKVSMKGPDDDNIVWIGHRYGSRMEADTVAATIESRLKESEG